MRVDRRRDFLISNCEALGDEGGCGFSVGKCPFWGYVKLRSNPQRWDLQKGQTACEATIIWHSLLLEVVEDLRIITDDLGIRLEKCHLAKISSVLWDGERHRTVDDS